jgi:pyruvate-ferredoxin/flavodoxin oxidoreductase
VAMGAKDAQTVKAFEEADAYPGTSIIIAYSHCIAHGYDLVNGPEQQRLAVDSGHWPLFRFDPRRIRQGQSPLQMDSGAPKIDIATYARNETRYRMVERQNPEYFRSLMKMAQRESVNRFAVYEQIARLAMPWKDGEAPAAAPAAAPAPEAPKAE